MSQVQIHSPILDPKNYVEELSDSDTDDSTQMGQLGRFSLSYGGVLL